MTGRKNRPKHRADGQPPKRGVPGKRGMLFALAIIAVGIAVALIFRPQPPAPMNSSSAPGAGSDEGYRPTEKWLKRAYAVDALFHKVFTPCWEGAYGAIGDAHLFAVTHDTALLRFYSVDHDLTGMCEGTWVDDRAWVCLAEMYWWRFTGMRDRHWLADAYRRYMEARDQGRLSHHEGYWSWYNWPPNAGVRERIFSNSNMNQMVSVACWLYEATGERKFLEDALLVWNGDSSFPGVEKKFYRGNGVWKGTGGEPAFGNPLPWEGAGYCSIAASLYRVTKEQKYKNIAVATARHLMNPANGWVDPVSYYQVRMDGNGAFVNDILDAYLTAPEELRDIPGKVEKMLDLVWTNAGGSAKVVLHRASDDGIRNGWNPNGGEQGYNVNEVGLVHAQGEAVRAFGMFAYVLYNAPESKRKDEVQ